jgi:hypothetical protein
MKQKFKEVWKMEDKIELSPEVLSSCQAKGYVPKGHPICRLRKEALEGKSKEQAEKECISENKLHGISKLRCLAIAKGIE